MTESQGRTTGERTATGDGSGAAVARGTRG